MFRTVRLVLLASLVALRRHGRGDDASAARRRQCRRRRPPRSTTPSISTWRHPSRAGARASSRTPRRACAWCSPRRDDLSGDERRAFDRLAENMEGVSWCAGENMVRVGDVRLLREDEATATYAFQPTRESVRGEQAQRFADRMRGELTLIKANPDISHIRVFTAAPFSPAAAGARRARQHRHHLPDRAERPPLRRRDRERGARLGVRPGLRRALGAARAQSRGRAMSARYRDAAAGSHPGHHRQAACAHHGALSRSRPGAGVRGTEGYGRGSARATPHGSRARPISGAPPACC